MKKDFLTLLILILPAFAILLQPGYFSMHDDLQSMRQLQLNKCLQDGQFPCRWSPDLGYGYGYPMFNFYPPLPYLIGQPFAWLGFGYIEVVKIVGVIGWILSAWFMYLLARQFWGRLGGLVSAAFYTYAPYHSVDFYVRGAINEFWAMVWYPAIFWSTYKIIQHFHPSPKLGGGLGVRSLERVNIVEGLGVKWIFLTALFVSFLMLSHNPMLMIFAPILVSWCLFWMWRFKTVQPFSHLTISAILALLLSAFFTLPVLFESKYVSLWTLTSGYFNYLAHFADLRQIFLTINWGYGASELGPVDGMSFAIGYFHWLIPGLLLILSLISKTLRPHRSVIYLLLLFTITSLFMTHSKSTPIWQAIKQLEFLQFPWRFLTISVFSASLLSGATVMFKRNLIPFLLLLLLLLNANFFRPREWYPDMTDAIKFSGKSWQLLVTSGIFDYLPIWAPRPPADPRGEEINLTGQAIYSPVSFTSNYQEYIITVIGSSAVAELQTYYFPGWRIWLNDTEFKIDPTRDRLLGRMQVDLPPGTHRLVARFTDTPIRRIANIVSLFAWIFTLLSLPVVLMVKIPLWKPTAK